MKVLKTDPKFLAVTGKALGSNEKFFEVTIRLNPDYDSTVAGSKEFQTVNATQISKKTHKRYWWLSVENYDTTQGSFN